MGTCIMPDVGIVPGAWNLQMNAMFNELPIMYCNCKCGHASNVDSGLCLSMAAVGAHKDVFLECPAVVSSPL